MDGSSVMQDDHQVDLLVVGSGAGAMTAALRAAHAGAQVLIVEKAEHYGGTSATSGGGLWIPCNHLMRDCAIDDSDDEALRYLRALCADDVPDANLRAFVDGGPRMLRWLCEHSQVRYQAMAYYADYYQHLDGAKPGGRSIDPIAYDARELGSDFAQLQAPHIQTRVLGLIGYTNTEGAVLLSKSPGWFGLLLKLLRDYLLDLPWRLRSLRSRRLTMGNALIGRLRRSLADAAVPLWCNSPMRELLTDRGASPAPSSNATAVRSASGRGTASCWVPAASSSTKLCENNICHRQRGASGRPHHRTTPAMVCWRRRRSVPARP